MLLTPKLYNARKLKVYAGDYLNSGKVADQIQNESQLLSDIAMFDDALNEGKFEKISDLFERRKSVDSYWGSKRRSIVRWKSYYELRNSPFVEGLNIENVMKRRSTQQIYEERSEFIFVLSPFGTGMDCFRTWEALIFGHIVIVQSSSLDPLYEGLPVVIVEKWSEINEDNLTKWKNQFFYNFTAMNNDNVAERLTTRYWYNLMKNQTKQLIAELV